MTDSTPNRTMDQWIVANQQYLDGELHLLRLLLQRRVLWLRKQWAGDEAPKYPGLIINDAEADRLLTGQNNPAEKQFYREDKKAAALSRSIAEAERNIEVQRQLWLKEGQQPAIDVLAHLFGLTAFDRKVLLLCLAPGLDPTFERLYAYAQDDVTQKHPTPHLALTLFGGEGEQWLAERRRLMPDAPLRRFRLVTLESGRVPELNPVAHPLRLKERIGNYLLGFNNLDEGASDILQVLPAMPLTDEQQDLVARLHRSLESGKADGTWPIVNLIGTHGSGKSAVARALCERLNLKLYGLDVARIPAGNPERQESLRLLERESLLSQFALYIDLTRSDSPADLQSRTQASDLLDRLGVFLVIGSQERWQTKRKIIGMHLSKPDAVGQRVLWERALAGLRLSMNGEIDRIVQQFDFGSRDITETVAAAQGHATLRTAEENPTLQADDLWQACREQARWHLDELAQRIKPCHTWDDIVLPEDIFQQLQEIAAQVANRAKVYEEWGFGAKLNRGRGINALFAGQSGTGKTLAAEILANHLDLSLYRIDLSGVVNKYIGETEKNLRKVFDAAEQSGAILFFDEADALFGKRSEVKDSHDRYANIEVNYLLQRMEDYRGLAVLATNMKSHLDEAFMRRLRFLVDFPFPDAEQRADIWRKSIPPCAAVEDLDYDALSRLDITGGNIKNIAVNAAFLAAQEGKNIGMDHLYQATRREYAKINKLVLESEFGAYYAMVRR
jgi:ATPase family associated with various cellular activities (AAA)